MQTSDASNFFQTETDLARADARSRKAKHIRSLENTTILSGTPISLQIVDGHLWTSESGAVARKTSLKTGKTVQLFKGHTGPVTCLQLVDTTKGQLLLTGSWDTTIRVWDVASTKALSATSAHGDFVKCLLVIPSLRLLISGSSDKTVKIWDLAQIYEDPGASPSLLGIISGHTRPVDCVAYDDLTGELYTADSMGRILVWRLELMPDRSTCRTYNLKEVSGHRTGINDLLISEEGVWSASTDETVRFTPRNPDGKPATITHKRPVKAMSLVHVPETNSKILVTGSGDYISTFDVTALLSGDDDVDSLGVTNAHAHDITSVVWTQSQVEHKAFPSISVLSAGLDGLLRRWKLGDLMAGVPDDTSSSDHKAPAVVVTFTEEEERELAELLNDD